MHRCSRTPGALGGAVSIRVPSHGAVCVTERKETGEALGRGGASAHTSGGGSLDRGAAACGSRCSGSALYASLDPEWRDGPHDGACTEAPSIRSLEASRRSPARMTPDPSKQRVSSLISACEVVATVRCLRRGACRCWSHALRSQSMTVCARWRLPEGAFVLPLRRWTARDTAKPGALGGAVSIRVPSHGAVCVTERKETGEALGRGGASAHTSGGGSLDRGAAACGSRCSGSALYASLDPEWRDGPHDGACTEAPSIRSLEASRRSPARMTPDPSKQRVSSLISACEVVATVRCLRRGACRCWSHALRSQSMTVCARWRLPEGAFVLPLRRWTARDTAKPGALGGAVSIRVPSHGAVCVTERKETGEALGRGGASAHTSGGGSLDRGAAACGSRCSGSALYASLDPEWRDGPHDGACTEAPSIRSLEASRRSPARMTPDPSKQRVSSLISACEVVATVRCLRRGACRCWSHALRSQSMTVCARWRLPEGAFVLPLRRWTARDTAKPGALGGAVSIRVPSHGAVCVTERKETGEALGRGGASAHTSGGGSLDRGAAACGSRCSGSALYASLDPEWRDGPHDGACTEAPSIRSLEASRRSPARMTPDPSKQRVSSLISACEVVATVRCLRRGACRCWSHALRSQSMTVCARWRLPEGAFVLPLRRWTARDTAKPGALGGAVSIRVPSHGAVCVTERKETGEALGRGGASAHTSGGGSLDRGAAACGSRCSGSALYASLDPEWRDGPHDGACTEAPSIRSLEASRRSPARMTPDPSKQRVSSLISACEVVATVRCLRRGACRCWSHALRSQSMTVCARWRLPEGAFVLPLRRWTARDTAKPGALGGAVSIRVPSHGAVCVTERKETGEALGRGGASAHTSGGGSLDRGAAACGSRCSGSALYASLDPEWRDGPHDGACTEAPSIRSLEASRRSPARMTPDPSKQRVSSLISACEVVATVRCLRRGACRCWSHALRSQSMTVCARWRLPEGAFVLPLRRCWTARDTAKPGALGGAVSIRVPSHGAVCVTERKETGEALGRGEHRRTPPAADPWTGAQQRVAVDAAAGPATSPPRSCEPGALGGAVSIRVPSHGAVCVTERKETGEALGRGGASAHTSGGGSLDRGAAACGSRCSGSALYASLDPEWRDGPHDGACTEAPSIRSLEASRRSPARMTPDPSKQRVSSLISACEVVATVRCLRRGACRCWSHALRSQSMTVCARWRLPEGAFVLPLRRWTARDTAKPGALGGAVSIRVPSHGAVCVTERKETGEALGRGGASAHTSGGGSLDRGAAACGSRCSGSALYASLDPEWRDGPHDGACTEAPSIRSLEASRRSPARMTPDPSKQRVSSLISACEVVATVRCLRRGACRCWSHALRSQSMTVCARWRLPEGAFVLPLRRWTARDTAKPGALGGAVSIRVPSHGAVCVTERKETGEALGRGEHRRTPPAADPWTGAQQRVAVDAAAGALGGAVSIRVPSHGAVCVTERKETGEALGRGGASAHTSGGGSLDRGAAACGSRCSGSALYASLDPEWRDGPHDGACTEAPSIRSLEASRRSPARMTPDPSKQRVSSLISACEVVATVRCLRRGACRCWSHALRSQSMTVCARWRLPEGAFVLPLRRWTARDTAKPGALGGAVSIRVPSHGAVCVTERKETGEALGRGGASAHTSGGGSLDRGAAACGSRCSGSALYASLDPEWRDGPHDGACTEAPSIRSLEASRRSPARMTPDPSKQRVSSLISACEVVATVRCLRRGACRCWSHALRSQSMTVCARWRLPEGAFVLPLRRWTARDTAKPGALGGAVSIRVPSHGAVCVTERKETGEALGRGEHRRTPPAADPWTGAQQRVAVDAAAGPATSPPRSCEPGALGGAVSIRVPSHGAVCVTERKETGEALGRGGASAHTSGGGSLDRGAAACGSRCSGSALYASLDPEWRDGPHDGACTEAPSIRSLEASRRSPARMTPDPSKQRVSSLISAWALGGAVSIRVPSHGAVCVTERKETGEALGRGEHRRTPPAADPWTGAQQRVAVDAAAGPATSPPRSCEPRALGGAVSIRVPSHGAVCVTERKETGEALGRGRASAHTSGGGSSDSGAAACGSRCSGSALYASLDPEWRHGPHDGACAEAPSIRSLEASRRSPARMTPDPSKQRVSSLISACEVVATVRRLLRGPCPVPVARPPRPKHDSVCTVASPGRHLRPASPTLDGTRHCQGVGEAARV
ncbi:MAG: hypothetical protein WDW38_001251 [Sanguina aurantia]